MEKKKWYDEVDPSSESDSDSGGEKNKKHKKEKKVCFQAQHRSSIRNS
jgi:hypothetical protein